MMNCFFSSHKGKNKLFFETFYGPTKRIIGRYLNRLSDLLFQMARYAQYFEGKEDRFK